MASVLLKRGFSIRRDCPSGSDESTADQRPHQVYLPLRTESWAIHVRKFPRLEQVMGKIKCTSHQHKSIFIHRCAPDVPFSSHSPFNSSSVMGSNSRTMMSNTSSKAGRTPSGTGFWITFKTKILSVSLNGMHKGCTSLMGKISPSFTPNHGTQIVFGRLKSVLTARLFNITKIYFDPVQFA
jgi:hypothetical protein